MGSMSICPERKPTAWARLSTGITSIFSTTAASAALASGTSSPRIDCCAAAMAIERAPLVGRVLPSRASSPTTAYWASRSEVTCPLPARMPKAIGRSKEAASLGRSAGARLITTRFCGRWKPELTIARSTRCVLSFTAASGSPTRSVLGSPAGETSTSTSTGRASMPRSEKVLSLASIEKPPSPFRGGLREGHAGRSSAAPVYAIG